MNEQQIQRENIQPNMNPFNRNNNNANANNNRNNGNNRNNNQNNVFGGQGVRIG